jgi:hypothetical protein
VFTTSFSSRAFADIEDANPKMNETVCEGKIGFAS